MFLIIKKKRGILPVDLLSVCISEDTNRPVRLSDVFRCGLESSVFVSLEALDFFGLGPRRFAVLGGH